jgi:methylated-DNA-[protein]-cysteine S-methyltransferase
MKKGHDHSPVCSGKSGKTLWESLIDTDAGVFCIEVSQLGIYRLRFPSNRYSAPRIKARRLARPKTIRKLLEMSETCLRQYFSGKPVRFSRLRVDETGWSQFEKRVLRTLRTIQRGAVLSYGHLAKLSGYPGAARAVGCVMRKNRIPIILPCHRIVRSDKSIGRYSCGIHWKKRLLLIDGSAITGKRIQRPMQFSEARR